MGKTRILVADDDQSIRWVISETAQKRGFDVDEAADGKEAIEKILTNSYALIFIDVRMPEIDGITVIESAVKSLNPSRFIVMTALKSPEPAARAASLGVMEYITKPFDLDEIERILETAGEIGESGSKKARIQDYGDDEYLDQVRIVGNSRQIIDLYRKIGKVAPTNLTVLITGERGTGKELLASTIHELSSFSRGEFVPVNMAAIPGELVEAEIFGSEKGAYTGSVTSRPGKIEAASKGTVFFDEIGDAPSGLQSKLLRFIQEKEFSRLGSNARKVFDGRIIAATNKNLENLARKGSFRNDLLDRLNVFRIHIPPLRDRKSDIPLLCRYFLRKYSGLFAEGEKSLSAEALSIMEEYNFPGNVRELENIIMKLYANSGGSIISDSEVCDLLDPELQGKRDLERTLRNVSFEKLIELKIQSFVEKLGKEIGSESDLRHMFLEQLERPLLRTVLEATGWNKMMTARILGINRNTLHSKIVKLKIQEKGRKRKRSK